MTFTAKMIEQKSTAMLGKARGTFVQNPVVLDENGQVYAYCETIEEATDAAALLNAGYRPRYEVMDEND